MIPKVDGILICGLSWEAVHKECQDTENCSIYGREGNGIDFEVSRARL